MRKILLVIAVVFFAVGYGIGHFRGNSTGYAAGFHDSIKMIEPLQEHQFPKYGNTTYKLSYRSENEISIECLNGADPASRKVVGDVMVMTCGEEVKNQKN
jgi:hypothetical protein